ncbi:hypothetical protein DSO57_1017055 [Entomophthora muscae]|uniref:Uncharacterized protein n=1 Tax=Entomophthora muscae TaxID=34485 RepID=A0ACC2T4Q1_9FUNG|nr:hypothetical protein DSO57_1017055 [Entomophthora muscae]
MQSLFNKDAVLDEVLNEEPVGLASKFDGYIFQQVPFSGLNFETSSNKIEALGINELHSETNSSSKESPFKNDWEIHSTCPKEANRSKRKSITPPIREIEIVADSGVDTNRGESESNPSKQTSLSDSRKKEYSDVSILKPVELPQILPIFKIDSLDFMASWITSQPRKYSNSCSEFDDTESFENGRHQNTKSLPTPSLSYTAEGDSNCKTEEKVRSASA